MESLVLSLQRGKATAVFVPSSCPLKKRDNVALKMWCRRVGFDFASAMNICTDMLICRLSNRDVRFTPGFEP